MSGSRQPTTQEIELLEQTARNIVVASGAASNLLFPAGNSRWNGITSSTPLSYAIDRFGALAAAHPELRTVLSKVSEVGQAALRGPLPSTSKSGEVKPDAGATISSFRKS